MTVSLILAGMIIVANNSASQFNPAITIGLSALQYFTI
jgi:glycerol uptake facilitator-like aquaporin